MSIKHQSRQLTSLHSAMESKGIPLRRQSRDDSNERAATIAKCIICQTQTDQTTTTSQRGRKRVAEAAEIRNDSVCKRLKDVIGQEFVYHVTNECYKSYTHKKHSKRCVICLVQTLRHHHVAQLTRWTSLSQQLVHNLRHRIVTLQAAVLTCTNSLVQYAEQ